MPFITEERRRIYDETLDKLIDLLCEKTFLGYSNSGDTTYCIYKMIPLPR